MQEQLEKTREEVTRKEIVKIMDTIKQKQASKFDDNEYLAMVSEFREENYYNTNNTK